MHLRHLPAAVVFLLCAARPLMMGQTMSGDAGFHISPRGYIEGPGLNVMMFDDFYPEGHQGGVTIVQSGERIAANGDLRLEPAPGQWSPVPAVGTRNVDTAHGRITVRLSYPDSTRMQGFNPVEYPDLHLGYSITAAAEGNSIRLTVDLEEPLARQWGGRVGFNLELFPGAYFGKHFFMDGRTGIFPRQGNGPMVKDADGRLQIAPLGEGHELVVAPEEADREIRIASRTGSLQLIDGRGQYNNGWFVVRSTIPAGATKHAVEWIITPKANPGWRYQPVIQVSQVGYHPRQGKFAVIELDRSTEHFEPVRLCRITADSERVVKADDSPAPWGDFLRYKYLRFDFSGVVEEGLYRIRYGSQASHPFEIRNDVFARDVWQPTLEYFLPVQMCHLKIRDRYKVWHGLCHMDDALMAPVNHNHFDGYFQHASTLTRFQPGEHVPGLNAGGWHDAGDYDLRVESQAATVYRLALAYEFFRNDYDGTSVDQDSRVVELHVPDGKPDILQQIEHGVLSIAGGYGSMGRLYRGIICPTIRQYVHLGDASTMSDNIVYREGERDPILHHPLPSDDRWVFTEVNPQRELYVAQTLAAASRVLKSFNPALADTCLRIAEELFARNSTAGIRSRVPAAAELYLTTSRKEYAGLLLGNADFIRRNVEDVSETIGRVVVRLRDTAFTRNVEQGVRESFARVARLQQENPYGVPYRPHIWGAGWEIQAFGVKQLFLHLGFPALFPSEYLFNAMNFVLGTHPGENTSSFASGVGVRSLTVAYGVNRDEWSYIPGGVASGTALIRPDLPELKTWPYFWQQAEYVMGGGATDFMLLAMAADVLFNKK